MESDVEISENVGFTIRSRAREEILLQPAPATAVCRARREGGKFSEIKGNPRRDRRIARIPDATWPNRNSKRDIPQVMLVSRVIEKERLVEIDVHTARYRTEAHCRHSRRIQIEKGTRNGQLRARIPGSMAAYLAEWILLACRRILRRW